MLACLTQLFMDTNVHFKYSNNWKTAIKEIVILIYVLCEKTIPILISALDLVTKQARFFRKWNRTK